MCYYIHKTAKITKQRENKYCIRLVFEHIFITCKIWMHFGQQTLEFSNKKKTGPRWDRVEFGLELPYPYTKPYISTRANSAQPFKNPNVRANSIYKQPFGNFRPSAHINKLTCKQPLADKQVRRQKNSKPKLGPFFWHHVKHSPPISIIWQTLASPIHKQWKG